MIADHMKLIEKTMDGIIEKYHFATVWVRSAQPVVRLSNYSKFRFQSNFLEGVLKKKKYK